MARGERGRVHVETHPVPPPDPRPYVPSICLPGNRETAFLALHPSVTGFLMHWVEPQHIPHAKNSEWCAGCRIGQTPFWKGFLGVLSINTGNRFILQIPEGCFRESGLFRDKSDAGNLAGVVFTSYRFGRGKALNRPAAIELIEDDLPFPKGNPFPLFPALARWWRMDTLSTITEVKRPEDAHQHMPDKADAFISRLREQVRTARRVKP